VTLSEHHGLVAAIEAHDPEAARRAMEAHLDAVMDEMERFSAKHPEVFAEA
jgi:DNA-binding GntR family transcriptional regulator